MSKRVSQAGMAAAVVMVLGAAAQGQSLLRTPPESTERQPERTASPGANGEQPGAPTGVPAAPSPTPPNAPAPTAPAAPPASPPAAPIKRLGGHPIPMEEASMFAVIAPKPKHYQKHDKVQIIINESSLQKHEQTMDTKKQYTFNAELAQFPSLQALVKNLSLKNGIGSDTPKLGVNSDNEFKGDGSYQRTDQVTAQISALVLDIKPNGLMVIEAKETIQSDEETKTVVVSGICDEKDITLSNTVNSSQLAELNIKVENTGEVKDTTTRGFIPRILETIFNF